jgi:hypothetical protein
MKLKRSGYFIIGAAFLLLAAGRALAQEQAEQEQAEEDRDRFTGHVVYGTLMIQNNDPDLDGGDYEIGLFGADAQKPFGGRTLRYGVEAGAMFSSDSDVRRFAAASGGGGGAVAVSVDISSVLIDYYFGGFVSFEPADWLRIYSGAGPLLIYGLRETEPEASEGEETTTESESGLGAGLYARAGLDLFFTKNLGLCAGARINETTLSFEDAAGKVDVEGWQYYFGLAFRF